MKRSFILMAIFGMLIIGLPIAIIWPSISNIREISHAILNEYRYLEERQQRGMQTKRVSAQYEAAKQYVPGLESLVLKKGSELQLVTDLERLAVEYRVTESLNLDLDHVTPKHGLNSIPLSITIEGPYHNTINYLHALRGLPVVIGIETVRMSPLDSTGTQVRINASGFVFQRL